MLDLRFLDTLISSLFKESKSIDEYLSYEKIFLQYFGVSHDVRSQGLLCPIVRDGNKFSLLKKEGSICDKYLYPYSEREF